jgi:acetyl esterase/lipase
MSLEAVVDQRTGVSVQARLACTAARLVFRPLLAHWPLTSWGMLPLSLVDVAAGLLPTPASVTFDTVDFGGFTGEWVRPAGSSKPEVGTPGVILYFHGGAFVTCGVATHRHAVARIAEATGLPVLSVAYRHLPTVRLAGSVADCLAVYRSVLEQGFDPQRVVLAGDSAGGCLAFATALAARDEGLPRSAGIVALSPWLDFDCAAKMEHPNARRDPFAPVWRLPVLAKLLGVDLAVGSPVNADLTGLPPTLLIAAESEILRCDAELMAQRLAAADVPVTLQLWAGQVHAFPVLSDLLPEARAAINEIGAFVRRLGRRGAKDVSALAG